MKKVKKNEIKVMLDCYTSGEYDLDKMVSWFQHIQENTFKEAKRYISKELSSIQYE